jgi:hypothetical protein
MVSRCRTAVRHLTSHQTHSATLPPSWPPTHRYNRTPYHTLKFAVLRCWMWAKDCPKHVELILDINKYCYLLHLVGFSILLCLHWWCAVKHKLNLWNVVHWETIWNNDLKKSPSSSKSKTSLINRRALYPVNDIIISISFTLGYPLMFWFLTKTKTLFLLEKEPWSLKS